MLKHNTVTPSMILVEMGLDKAPSDRAIVKLGSSLLSKKQMDLFEGCMGNALDSCLDIEWLSSFVKRIREGNYFDEACYIAMKDWDL